jgi:uncharacterized protein YceK
MRTAWIVVALLLLALLAGCGGVEWHMGAYIEEPVEIEQVQ